MPIRLGTGKLLYLPEDAPEDTLTPWYLAGDCPAPIAVWQPKADSDGLRVPTSIEESYYNVVNPGTYNAAPGTAPVWAAATGWTFTQASLQYLTTGVIQTAVAWSCVVRFSGIVGNTRVIFGAVDAAPNRSMEIVPNNTGANVFYANGGTGSGTAAPALLAGTIGIANKTGYRNGVSDATISTAGAGLPGKELYIGCLNNNGTPSLYATVVITAIAVWDTNIAAYMADVHAALVAAGL